MAGSYIDMEHIQGRSEQPAKQPPIRCLNFFLRQKKLDPTWISRDSVSFAFFDQTCVALVYLLFLVVVHVYFMSICVKSVHRNFSNAYIIRP